ncbi:MAG: type II toxin-antitoxin system RelB/DinJ family antitoxin [Clostridiales bacterium]|jgi:DNA-damage-inducible protein J|nr:type II toxin-antitoxin system RelB/DinJ family antitoxin [Clostridiales bacterium]
MSSQSTLSVILDSKLKEETSAALEKIGLDFTTTITVYFDQIVRGRKIPFEILNSKYYSVEEVVGANWREDVDSIEDEWE